MFYKIHASVLNQVMYHCVWRASVQYGQWEECLQESYVQSVALLLGELGEAHAVSYLGDYTALQNFVCLPLG